MLRKMGVGIIGVGFIGERHAKTMYELECEDLVAVADINANRSKEIALKYGGEPYTNY